MNRSLSFLVALVLLGTFDQSLVFPPSGFAATPKTSNDDVQTKESATNSPEFEAAILADWERQEQKRNRSLDSVEASIDLIDRAEKLIRYLEDEELADPEFLDPLRNAVADLDAETLERTPPARRLERYRTIRWAIRNAAFHNERLVGKPLVFMKGDRFVCQMLHEYLGYYYQHSGLNGGGLFLLTNPGFSDDVRELGSGRFPKGVFSTPSLSWDAKTLYFAFADLSKVQADDAPILTSRDMSGLDFHHSFDEYQNQEEGKFHLFQMNLDDERPVQLTFGTFDDFDPQQLPDGSLAFLSTRRGGYTRCNSGWEPLQVHTLHRLPLRSNADSKNPADSLAAPFDASKIETLSWHETNEWHPSVLNDGRLIYTRWDYVDRSAQQYHGLWLTNPDGTAASVLFGSYTEAVNACYQAKPIPDSNKILFVVGGHHTVVGGSLVLLDPAKIRYNPETGEDDLASLERITPEIPFTETPKQVPDSYYFSPWPLSEDVYWVAYSPDPLGGMLSSVSPTQTGRLGLYYRDRFGNLELVYEDPNVSCQYPIPCERREKPPILASTLPKSGDVPRRGTFVLSDVNESLVPFPKDRPIRELRIFQLLPKFPEPYGNNPSIGHAYAENARLFLGTVPVETDGSAHFEAPSNVPLYFQAVDADGRAVQSMRSAVYLQPGENRGCVGCHEQAWTVQQNLPSQTIAFGRSASKIQPGPQEFSPLSYPRLIQPILDRACVSCHSTSPESTETAARSETIENQAAENDDSNSLTETRNVSPDLTGSKRDGFTESYINLRPYLRWYEWGGSSIRQITTLPGCCGADESPLSAILNDEIHRNLPRFSDDDRRTIYLWLDANASFFGVYDKSEQKRQLNGERVDVPELQ